MSLRRSTTRLVLPFAALLAASLGACSQADAPAEAQEGEVNAGAALFGGDTAMFQDDRVGRALKEDLGSVPSDYPSFEKLFRMGRACVRPDGKKEIFIVEEAQTRPIEGGSSSASSTGKLLPRAVVTGCNAGDSSDPSTLKASFSLMTALISDMSVPGADRGDTMSMTPLEVMAYDDATGLFNFYVFEPTGGGKPGTVTRFWRDGSGKVMQRRLVGGTTTPTEPKPHVHDACFRCHVNGAPIMNELAEPWTNWISPKKKLPTGTMGGTTKALVEQASLADQLESIIRAGTETFVNGLHAKDGWVNRTRDGLLPGGVSELLEPLFCQGELNYLSADTSLGIPLQVFYDPSVTAAAGLSLPNPKSGATLEPFLFPIRAVRDELVERTLVKRDYITDGMAVAIRLLDDENDVFSTKRCGVFGDVKKEIAKAEAGEADKQLEPKDVKALVRRAIEAKLPGLGLEPARLAYLEARLAGTVHQAKRDAYLAELTGRFEKVDKDVAKRDATRKASARNMFPDDALNPKPILDAR